MKEAKLSLNIRLTQTSSIKKKRSAMTDWDYLHGVERTLSEWNSPEDNAAYDDL
jgi:hypothetical protein